jgi:hypothetical protein
MFLELSAAVKWRDDSPNPDGNVVRCDEPPAIVPTSTTMAGLSDNTHFAPISGVEEKFWTVA